MLKIVAKAEIAQHFKICPVTRRFPHALDIRRTDTFLTGGDALAGGVISPVKYFFMGAIPELISSKDLSFCGISEKLGSRKWPLLSKNARYFSLNSFSPVHCIVNFRPFGTK